MLCTKKESGTYIRVHFGCNLQAGGREVGSKRIYYRKTEVPAPKANLGHYPSAVKLCDSCTICQSV